MIFIILIIQDPNSPSCVPSTLSPLLLPHAPAADYSFSAYHDHSFSTSQEKCETFLSDCYGGRASDKFIISDSGFYDLIKRDDELWQTKVFKSRKSCSSDFVV